MRKPDKARKLTDKELERIEKRLESVYRQSESEIREKWDNYMKRSEKRVQRLQEAYEEERTEEAFEALKRAKLNQTLQNAQYKAMVDITTTQLTNVNVVALAYVTGRMPIIYTLNHNRIEPTADKLGIDFTIYNENTVKNMIKAGDIKLPKKKVSIPKDKRWNTKKLNSEVLQGILQGESMDKIAERILPVVESNKDSAIRNARTMVTQVENKGRLDSFYELQEMGVIIEKEWSAVNDDRTRESHQLLDGETVPLDKPFSNGLMYPADPNGDASEVWQCRCSMYESIIGFKDNKGRIHYL